MKVLVAGAVGFTQPLHKKTLSVTGDALKWFEK